MLSSNQNNIYNQCKEALNLFLAGQQTKLHKKLQNIQQLKRQQDHGATFPQNKQQQNQFASILQCNKEEQGKKTNAKRESPKPKVPSQRKSQNCIYCPDNKELYLLSASNYVYLAMPKLKTFRIYPHYIIAAVDHVPTKLTLDQQTLEEIKNYQKCLIQMLEKMNLHAIFIEQFVSNHSHIFIECLGIPLKKAYDLPFFFKQALENVQGFWTTHKQIIKINKQKGGLHKQIPKQMKYFYIDFGLGYGYAHVIENEKQWDSKFCYEIVAAALGMQSYEIKTIEQWSRHELEGKSKEFDKRWKLFDWTTLIDKKN